MKNSKVSALNIFVPIVAIIAIVLLVVSIEFYEEEVTGEWSLEALQNPYLAAEQFLEKTGIDVEAGSRFNDLENLTEEGTLFISESSQIDNQKLLDQVLGYLETGGNVIAGVSLYGNNDNYLIQHFGVDVEHYYISKENDDDDFDKEEEQSLADSLREYNDKIEEGKTLEEIAEENEGDDKEILTLVEFEYPTENLNIHFDTDTIFIHDAFTSDGMANDDLLTPTSWSRSDHGVHFMQFVVGNGLLTLVSDASIWSSYRIAEHDHAYLLWILTEGNGNLTILRSVIRDSLPELIARNAFELFLAVLLLAVAWVWRIGLRFGRVVDEDFQISRARGEHLLAMGRYLWHRKKSEFLLAALRQRIQRRSNLIVAGYHNAESLRQFELLAKYCNLNTDAVVSAFQLSEFNEHTFVHTVKTLKQVEHSL